MLNKVLLVLLLAFFMMFVFSCTTEVENQKRLSLNKNQKRNQKRNQKGNQKNMYTHLTI